MQHDLKAHGFPRDLDGHPLLAWMGEDWVRHVALALLTELRKQDPGTTMSAINCGEPPQLESRVRPESGAVTAVSLRLRIELLVGDASGREHLLQGVATFTGPEPRTLTVEFSVTPQERMIGVLREARALVSRPDNSFDWSSWEDAEDAVWEIERFIDELELRPVRKRDMDILFLPTGPMQEVAVSSGWGQAFLDLANRFDAIEMVAADTWSCRICDSDAGSIELRENGDLRRKSFTSVLSERVEDPGRFGRLWDAIAAGDAAALFAVDEELAPWWCPECAACYCGEHWAREDVFDEDAPAHHDSIRGRCPEGHERMLED